METATCDTIGPRPRLPVWMRRRLLDSEEVIELKKKLRSLNLHTVCQSAGCPNIGECFRKPTATFLILGDTCTRRCRFCGVSKGPPQSVDPGEPRRIAEAVRMLRLKHAVVTSVTRDDLQDGGAEQFARTVRQIHEVLPETTVETLIPDFQGNLESLRIVLDSQVAILNHNIETVPSLYAAVRVGADFQRSLNILREAKEMAPRVIVKSGLMVGLGETEKEMVDVFNRLHENRCDVLTIGQYLPPNKESIPVKTFVSPEGFRTYEHLARKAGIRWVSSGPYVRSSFNADELMRKVKENDGE